MTDKALFYEEEKLEWEVIDHKISRQIVGFNDKIMMVNVRFKAGGVGALHSHHHSQVTYIAEGKFEVTIDGKTKLLKTRDSFYIPSNIIHGVVCIDDGVLVDVFSPMREDFVTKS